MEEETKSPKIGLEHVPTLEEVQAVFQELTGGRYEEVRRAEDEKGLYLLDVKIAGKSEGESIGYEYMRAGRYPEGEASETQIHIVYYKDELPVGGTSAAKYVDGEWRIL